MSQVVTLYKDKEKTDALYPRTKLSAISDNNNKALSEIINDEVNARQAADNVLNARINAITSLPEGSTTGDAELQDIRVGANGTTYPNAGDAVRGQISELKGDLNTCFITTDNYNDSSKAIANARPYLTVGVSTLNDNQTINNSSISSVISVSEGEEWCAVNGSMFVRGIQFCYYDSDGLLIGYENNQKNNVTIPSNCSYMRVSCAGFDNDSVAIKRFNSATNVNIYPHIVNSFYKKDETENKIELLRNELYDEILELQTDVYDKFDNLHNADESVSGHRVYSYADWTTYKITDLQEYPNASASNIIKVEEGKKYTVITNGDLFYGSVWCMANKDGIIFDNGILTHDTPYVEIPVNGAFLRFSEATQNQLFTTNKVAIKEYTEDMDYIIRPYKKQLGFTKKDDVKNIIDDYHTWLDTQNKTTLDRLTLLEKQNPFKWGTYDKGYFVFSFDDGNVTLSDIANVFNSRNVPMTACIIADDVFFNRVMNDGSTLVETIQTIQNHGGEILSHSVDANVFSTGMDKSVVENKFALSKYRLEQLGLNIRGFTKPGGEGSEGIYEYTDILRKYYQYGYSCSNVYENFSQWRWDIEYTDIDDLKAKVDYAVTNKTVLHLYCHNYTENIATLLDYIIAKGSDKAQIVTLGYMFDNFASSKFEQRIKALENA